MGWEGEGVVEGKGEGVVGGEGEGVWGRRRKEATEQYFRPHGTGCYYYILKTWFLIVESVPKNLLSLTSEKKK